jgi:hypothetical protein
MNNCIPVWFSSLMASLCSITRITDLAALIASHDRLGQEEHHVVGHADPARWKVLALTGDRPAVITFDHQQHARETVTDPGRPCVESGVLGMLRLFGVLSLVDHGPHLSVLRCAARPGSPGGPPPRSGVKLSPHTVLTLLRDRLTDRWVSPSPVDFTYQLTPAHFLPREPVGLLGGHQCPSLRGSASAWICRARCRSASTSSSFAAFAPRSALSMNSFASASPGVRGRSVGCAGLGGRSRRGRADPRYRWSPRYRFAGAGGADRLGGGPLSGPAPHAAAPHGPARECAVWGVLDVRSRLRCCAHPATVRDTAGLILNTP